MTTVAEIGNLEELLARIREVRALLPDIMGTLAQVPDDTDCTVLFNDILAAVSKWQAQYELLDSKREELEPIMASLLNETSNNNNNNNNNSNNNSNNINNNDEVDLTQF